MPDQKDVGQQLQAQRRIAKDKQRPNAPIRLPHKKVASFKLPTKGLPEQDAKFSKRSVSLINPKLFRNLYQPEKQVVEGTLNLT